MPKTKIKICCISSTEEARIAARCGAAALGLVSEMPSGPGVIDDRLIREIVATIPPEVRSFLLTSRQSARDIIEQHRRCRTNTIQICDHLPHTEYRPLRQSLPGVSLVQVIHVNGEEALSEAIEASIHVDGILLDSGNRKSPVKELGGTGRCHDWKISRRIRESIAVPVYLAGGLHAGNVAEAIGTVQPYAVDVCSGVRTEGRLDEMKLTAFVSEVASGGV